MAFKVAGKKEEPKIKGEVTEAMKEEIKENTDQNYPELVVDELPQTQARMMRMEDGNLYKLMTSSEAIQETLEGVRELLKRTQEE